MYLEKVIFAIDDDKNSHTVAKFMRYMDTQRAMGNLRGGFTQCIGAYDGNLEVSYMVDRVDFDLYVKGYCERQSSVLRVPGDTRQPCTLSSRGGLEKNIGTMKEIDPLDIHKYSSWTYVIPTGKYFSTQGE